MDQNRLNYLLQSLAHGLLTPGEYEELIDLIHRKEAEDDLLEGMGRLLEEANPGEVDEGLYRRIWEAAERKGAASGRGETREGTPAGRGGTARVRRIAPRIWLAAASVLVLAGVALLWRHTYNPGPKAAPLMSYRTAKGERRQLWLPDSTRVWLNAESRLTYAAGDLRQVHLEGEAYFEVRRDPQHPFVVQTGMLSTRVLGTAFDIDDYDPGVVTVTVTEGAVRVDSRTATLARLTANKQLRLAGDKVTLSDVSGDALSAWRNGELIFNNTSMAEAARRIGRWFGVPVRLDASSVRDAHVTVSFIKGENLHEVMEVVCMLNGCTYRMEQGTVVISTR